MFLTHNPRIGEFDEKDGYKNRRRAAYDDQFKLIALFPSQLADQKVSKNAADDVQQSLDISPLSQRKADRLLGTFNSACSRFGTNAG